MYWRKTKENKAIAKSQCCEMRFYTRGWECIKNLGDVLTSPESDFSQCKKSSRTGRMYKKVFRIPTSIVDDEDVAKLGTPY